jgi:hypothetical protein
MSFSIFNLFSAQLSIAQKNLVQIEKDAVDFVHKEVSAVDAAVVSSLKKSLGDIFTPALWSSLKTVAGQSAALLANEAFSLLTGQETMTVAVAHFLGGVEKLGLNSGLVPSVIAHQMVSAGQAMVHAGVGAAVSAADVAALKADIDHLISLQAIPAHLATPVATAAAAVVAVAAVSPVATGPQPAPVVVVKQ